jgi:hypothetical protein
MSRVIKLHERYWHAMKGFQSCFGIMSFSDCIITAEKLVEVTKTWDEPLDNSQAREMIWFASYAEDCPKNCVSVQTASLSTTLFLNKWERKLPPRPREWKPVDADKARPSNKGALKTMKSMLRSRESLQDEVDGLVDPHTLFSDLQNMRFSEIVEVAPHPSVTGAQWAVALHKFLEQPHSGRLAEWFSLVMTVLILLSVLTLVIEPILHASGARESAEDVVWLILDGLFSVFFTVELFARFLVSDAMGTQTKMDFLMTPLNIVDAVAVLPFYIDLATVASRTDTQHLRLLRFLRLMRLARFMRLGRLSRNSAIVAPVTIVLLVIWGIFMKNSISTDC